MRRHVVVTTAVGLATLAGALLPASAAWATPPAEPPSSPPTGECVVSTPAGGFVTQACSGTYRDPKTAEEHDYACAGAVGRGACAWTVRGSAVPGGTGVCAYSYNDASSTSPRTPTACVNDAYGCVANGYLEHPGNCDPDT